MAGSNASYAVDVSDVAQSMVVSSELIPGLITAISYLLALLLGVLGILNLKRHVEKVQGDHVPLKKPIIQFIAGGALLALPAIYAAMAASINGGANVNFDPGASPINFFSGGLGIIAGFLGGGLQDVNGLLTNFTESIEDLPGLISAISYVMGLVLGVLGILKIKDHVENPEQTPLKVGVIRLLVGGALFAIPTVYDAMYNSIGGLGLLGNIAGIFGIADILFSGEAGEIGCGFGATTMGDAICNTFYHTTVLPAFLSALAYLIGLVLGLWALVKVKDHVENPQQTKVSEPISRLVAAGLFFALPLMIEVARNTTASFFLVSHTNTGFSDGTGGFGGIGGAILGAIGGFLGLTGPAAGGGAAGQAVGLSLALQTFMVDLLGPITVVLTWFGYVAGTILIMIAIMRLIKSSQDGARGPGGFGTLMTFITGGALISFNQLMTAFTASLFTNPVTTTRAELVYTVGMTQAELAHAHIVISAVLKFMIIVGLISFVRGIFIIRDVAEGKQQSSIMSGVTHMVGGSLAVNLGPVLNAVQATLGVAQYGVAFT